MPLRGGLRLVGALFFGGGLGLPLACGLVAGVGLMMRLPRKAGLPVGWVVSLGAVVLRFKVSVFFGLSSIPSLVPNVRDFPHGCTVFYCGSLTQPD